MIAVLAVFLAAIIRNDWSLLLNASGSIGVFSLLASGLFLGMFTDGERTRANHYVETMQSRRERMKMVNATFLFALPNLVVPFLYYGITYYIQ